MRNLLFVLSLLTISLSAIGHDNGNPHEGTTMRHAESNDGRHLHEYVKDGKVVLRIWATECWTNADGNWKFIRDFTADDAKAADCDDTPTPTPDSITPDPIPPEPDPIVPDPDIPPNDTPADPTPIESSANSNETKGVSEFSGNGNTAPPSLTPKPQGIINTPPARSLAKLLVTEYMVRDWSHYNSNLPQAIEVYNPNSTPVNLNGYTLEVWEWHIRKGTQKKTIEIGEITIPPKAVVLLVTHLSRQSTIEPSRVFNLAIGNSLQRGFTLKDPTGDVIVEIEQPQKPLHQGKSRVSYHRYVNTVTEYDEPHYYGHPLDISTLGIHEFVRPAPSLTPLKKSTLWATLKKRE